jgi:hypothetical protein
MDKSVKRGVSKKPYRSPVLTVYGTVRELTQAVGIRRNRDGGRFPRIRTSIR